MSLKFLYITPKQFISHWATELKTKISDAPRAINPLKLLAFLLIEFLFLIYLYGCILLVSGNTLSGFIWPAALISTLATLVWFTHSRYSGLWPSSIVGLIFIILIAAFTTLSATFYDISSDGQTYHQEAIIQFSEGWNPLLTQVSDLYRIQVDALVAAINYYPKAPWIIASVHHAFFDNIESGKVTVWLLATSAFLIVYNISKNDWGFSRSSSLMIALALILNPIAISQSLSFYIDGHVYYLLIISLACLLEGQHGRQPDLLTYTLFTMALSVLVNTKVPAVAFAGFFILSYIGYSCLIFIRYRDSHILKSALIFSTCGLFALILMGYHPYVTNTIKQGNPFHTVLGDDRVIETATQRPKDFENLSSVEMFYRSLFSTSANPPWGGSKESTLKMPLTVDWPAEGKAFTAADLRTGSFGPLFSGILLISAILATLIAMLTRQWRSWTSALSISALLFLSSILHPEAWWLRYVPQFYLVPIVFSVFILHQAQYFSPGTIFRYIGVSLLGLLVLNAILGASFYFPKVVEENRLISAKLKEIQDLSTNHGQIYEVYFGAFPSNRIRLESAGIPYFELGKNDNRRCLDIIGMPSSPTYVCIDRLVTVPSDTPFCKTSELVLGWKDMSYEQREQHVASRQCRLFPKSVSAGLVHRGELTSQLKLLNLYEKNYRLWVSNKSLDNSE